MTQHPPASESKHNHEYERLNPGADRPNPHRPESSYGMNTGKAGGTYGDADGEYTAASAEGDTSAPTPGGQPQEKVDDRPNVSTVEPEDYPAEQRESMKPAPDKTDKASGGKRSN